MGRRGQGTESLDAADNVAEHVIWTKEQAWAPRGDELYFPIDTSRHPVTLRRRWFHHRNCCTFSTFLTRKFSPNLPWNVLTIGVFEGAQEVWLMQNCLQHPESHLVCIDPWKPVKSGKQDAEFMEQCYKNTRNNLGPWASQIRLVRGYSQEILAQVHVQGHLKGIELGMFDLVIIDGDHNAPAVFQDAVLTFDLLQVGGWQLFDDVRNQQPKKHHVKEGLEQYLLTRPTKLKFAWAHRFCDCYERVG